jgi:hypothetical protein
MKKNPAYFCFAGLLIVAILAGGLLAPPASIASGKSASDDAQIDGSDVKSQPILTGKYDGTKLLQEMTIRLKQLGSYRFDGALATARDKGVKVDSGSFYYMPESYIRVEVKGKGCKAGSVLVRGKNGIIRARGGPALLGMKTNLQPDSNMLMLANGLNIIECDYASLINWLKKQIASGQKVYASEGPLLINPQQDRVLVLETVETEQGNNTLAHRILIDPQYLVPVEWDIFKKGKFFSTVRFKNFEARPAMDESLFHI